MSGQGSPFHEGCGCSSTVLRLAAGFVALAVALTGLSVASSACAPKQPPPDTDTVSDCAELDNPPAGCEP